ncbi:DUF1648 domain-containing protein [Arabiibacter massiliensis]|uniref:DUF1648 domain-containing protein n=1 Tax=Arabiibacter massiliensis TaxID=1870985 RepID=UPI00155AD8C3|nr:DUF1648 domain-containing protein [Arabiibacter massiliensis]
MSRKSMSRYEGTALEGRSGLAVAIVLGVAAAALAALQWVLLPDQVAMQFGLNGQVNTWAPKWVPVLATAGLGLFGAVWFGASRQKLALLIAAIGMAIGVFGLVVNGVLF